MLEKRLKLKKTHYVIYAEQPDFMKPYITFNNEKKKTEYSVKKKINLVLIDANILLYEIHHIQKL